MPADHPTQELLQRRCGQLAATAEPFAGVLLRSTSIEHARIEDLLNGEGARRFGGRWNPVGLAAVYGSTTPETALAEALAHCRYYGIPVQQALPRVFVAIDVRLQAVLDLTRGDIRRRLGVAFRRMVGVDWRCEMHDGAMPLTQRIGRAAAEAGLEGLLVPSAAERRGVNLVVFPQNLRNGSAIAVIEAHRLPR